jgi:hypothetical protein
VGAGVGLAGGAGGAVRRASVRWTRGRVGAGGFACEGRRATGTGAGAAGAAFRATSGADGGGSLFGAGGRVESFRPRAGFGGSPAAPDAGPESAGAERGGCAGAAIGLRLIGAAGSAGFALGCGPVSGAGGDGSGGGGVEPSESAASRTGGGGGVEPAESADRGASPTGGGAAGGRAASAAGAAGDRETLRREISSIFGFGASDFSRVVLAGSGAGLLAAVPADGSTQSTGPSTLNSHLAASSLTPGSLGIRGSSASGCAAGAASEARATVACRSGG